MDDPQIQFKCKSEASAFQFELASGSIESKSLRSYAYQLGLDLKSNTHIKSYLNSVLKLILVIVIKWLPTLLLTNPVLPTRKLPQTITCCIFTATSGVEGIEMIQKNIPIILGNNLIGSWGMGNWGENSQTEGRIKRTY